MKISYKILVLVYFFCINILLSQETKEINKSIISYTAEPINNEQNFNDLYSKNSSDFLKEYSKYFQIANYKKALFYARLAFSNAENIEDKIISLMHIADVYVAVGDYKKAKLVYRQIIRNYSEKKFFIQEAKEKLLKL